MFVYAFPLPDDEIRLAVSHADKFTTDAMQNFHVYLYGPNRQPLTTSFDETEARLVKLPRLCFEPDGSFAWACGPDREQVFGMLYDAGAQLQYCELRGACHHTAWKQLIVAVVGQPRRDLELLVLPDQRLEDLQTFEARVWSLPDQSERQSPDG